MSPDTAFGVPYLAALSIRMAEVRRRARSSVSGISANAMSARPPSGGWSVGEIFEHLCVANISYERPVAQAIAKARARRGPPRAHRSTLGGGFLIRTLMPGTRGVPTLRPYVPLTPRERVVDAFLGSLDTIEREMHEADGLDLRVMLTSPVMPLLRMNLGEAFTVAVVHAERHLGQVERTRRAVEA
jgi:hypothetical protein